LNEVNDAFNRSHKIVILEQIYGSKVRVYPDWWLNKAYKEFMNYDCTPQQFRNLFKKDTE